MFKPPYPIYDADSLLLDMLEQAHVSTSNPDLVGTWEVFKAFVQLPFDSVSDGILFEYGYFSHLTKEAPEFSFDFLRQFKQEGDDEYEQLRCCFYYPVTEELAKVEADGHWWFDDAAALPAFLSSVETHRVFQLLRTAYSPIRVEIYQTGT